MSARTRKESASEVQLELRRSVVEPTAAQIRIARVDEPSRYPPCHEKRPPNTAASVSRPTTGATGTPAADRGSCTSTSRARSPRGRALARSAVGSSRPTGTSCRRALQRFPQRVLLQVLRRGAPRTEGSRPKGLIRACSVGRRGTGPFPRAGFRASPRVPLPATCDRGSHSMSCLGAHQPGTVHSWTWSKLSGRPALRVSSCLTQYPTSCSYRYSTPHGSHRAAETAKGGG